MNKKLLIILFICFAILATGVGILIYRLTRPDPLPHQWEEEIIAINDRNPNIFILGQEINLHGLNHTRINNVMDVTYRTRPFAYMVINNWNGNIELTQAEILHLRYLNENHSIDILYFGNSSEKMLEINMLFESHVHPDVVRAGNIRSVWIRPTDLPLAFTRFSHVASSTGTNESQGFWLQTIINNVHDGLTDNTLRPDHTRPESTRP